MPEAEVVEEVGVGVEMKVAVVEQALQRQRSSVFEAQVRRLQKWQVEQKSQ